MRTHIENLAVAAVALLSVTLAGCPDRTLRCGSLFRPDETGTRCTCLEDQVELPDGTCMLADGGVVTPPGLDAGVDASTTTDAAAPDSGVGGSDSALPMDSCVESTFFRDGDGDGYGTEADAVTACTAPDGYVDADGDCDDECVGCNPAAAEVCSTSIDEDCDGDPVNGCSCTIGTVTHCTACGDACGWDCEADGCNDAVALDASGTSSCALREDRTVVCWGSNAFGQLGHGGATGETARSITPVRVSGLTNVVQIDVGEYHACARTDAGEVWCWGRNESGQLGNGRSGTGELSTAPVRVAGVEGATDITAGGTHSCALVGDRVRCWGSNAFGQIGNGESGLGLRVANATEVRSLTGASAVTAGFSHTCALVGTAVRCWGLNQTGQLGNGMSGPTLVSATPVAVAGLSNAASIAAGGSHTCAVTTAAALRCWGNNTAGQVGNGTSGASEMETSPVAVTGLMSVTRVYPGSQHTCALNTLGIAYCWGSNASGQIGNGRSGSSMVVTTPTAVMGLGPGATRMGGGNQHTCAVAFGSGVKCWGGNGSGQLGDGTISPRTAATATMAP